MEELGDGLKVAGEVGGRVVRWVGVVVWCTHFKSVCVCVCVAWAAGGRGALKVAGQVRE